MAKLAKRPDGRCVKTITDPRTGKRVYFYGKTEREINRKIMEYSQKLEMGRTFIEVSADWWDEAEASLAYQSQKSYRAALTEHLSISSLMWSASEKKLIEASNMVDVRRHFHPLSSWHITLIVTL